MSSYLAVGGVSAVLQSLLSDALTIDGPSALLGSSSPGITALAPDLITTGPDEPPQLNLFMYYVSLNPAMRNLDLPSIDSSGNPVGNPPLAVNLHYLVTAYGSKQYDSEILLGWAMTVFHATPVVAPATIQAALSSPGLQSTTEGSLVATSLLAEQIEHLRITPEALSTEEIYRLWAAFQAAYRPSTAFQVSVVVIQDTSPYSSNLPVQTPPQVSVQTLNAPSVTSISPSMVAAGSPLTITGTNFSTDATSQLLISFNGQPGISPSDATPSTITVTPPATLAAGTVSLRVQRQVVFPNGDIRPGFQSSPASFQLIPTISDPSPVAATQGTTLSLTVSPAVGPMQQVTLYVGDSALPISQRTVTDPPSTSLSIPIPADQATGTFPLRVEIDGAQSALTAGAGGFDPRVVVGA